MASFDPEMINFLAKIVDEAWAKAPPGRARDAIAERIVKAAIRGERNPDRLRMIGTIEEPGDRRGCLTTFEL